MIKGHTKIELTNVETGETEIHEDDNLWTNAFRYLFANAMGSVSFTTRNSYSSADKNVSGYRNLFPYKLYGGILAFENPLEESADNVMYPKGNKITARGTDFAYTGIETELGSMSVTDTGFQEDGSYRLVWNFDTAHGNGQISAVALTSPFGGRIGRGCSTEDNTDVLYNSEDDKGATVPTTIREIDNAQLIGGRIPDFYEAYRAEQNEMLGTQQYTNYAYPCQTLYVNGDKDEMLILSRGQYCFTKNNTYSGKEYIKECGQLRINKFRYPNKKISILDGALMKYLGDEIITIPEPICNLLNTNTDSTIYGSVWSDYGYIYMLMHPKNTIAPDEQFYILKIDVGNYGATAILMTNTNLNAITLNIIQANINKICGNNDYIVFVDDTAKRLVRMSLTDNTDIKILKAAGEEYIVNQYATRFGFDETNLYFQNDTKCIAIDLYDPDNEVKKIQCSMEHMKVDRYAPRSYMYNYILPVWQTVSNQGVSLWHAYISHDVTFASKMCDPAYDTKYKVLNAVNTSKQISSIPNDRLLYTINNLSSPVTKTAAQTMTITYTLQEVEDQ